MHLKLYLEYTKMDQKHQKENAQCRAILKTVQQFKTVREATTKFINKINLRTVVNAYRLLLKEEAKALT